MLQTVNTLVHVNCSVLSICYGCCKWSDETGASCSCKLYCRKLLLVAVLL